MKYKVLRIGDEDYPKHLRHISSPPKLLYYIGNLDLIQSLCIGMVGTRRCSPYGRWAAREISRRIAGCGIPIVSGMAEGIDSESHKGCLDRGTGTVAVLGTGIDVPFPKSNIALYEKIAQNGLILSEYPPGGKGYASNFPARNRIIAGLCSKLIVVEGQYKSGSMITARLALNQGRDVYAVPGNINQPGSLGVNSLIADGAIPIISIDELFETLGIVGTQLRIALANARPEELKILDAIRNAPGISVEELAINMSIRPELLSGTICRMELKDLLKSDGNRLYYT